MIPRSGWVSHGVSTRDVESVAEHTFSTCLLSLLLADLEIKRESEVNVERVLRMAVLHDLAESLTFDISRAYLDYMGRRGEAIKQEIEASAWKHLADRLKNPELARKYRGLQREYLANETIEAKIVHAADSLDILLQTLDYRRRGYPQTLLADLWKERTKIVKASDVQSAASMLKLMMNESRKIKSERVFK